MVLEHCWAARHEAAAVVCELVGNVGYAGIVNAIIYSWHVHEGYAPVGAVLSVEFGGHQWCPSGTCTTQAHRHTLWPVLAMMAASCRCQELSGCTDLCLVLIGKHVTSPACDSPESELCLP